MENAGSQNPHPRDWRVLYRSAILETNNSEMAKRLSDAREAIAEHIRELFRETGVDVDGEREAMNEEPRGLRHYAPNASLAQA